MYSVESSGKKPLSIPLPILIPSVATNQAGFLLVGLNNANTNENDRKNAVVVDSAVGNKKSKESNGDAKVDLKV